MIERLFPREIPDVPVGSVVVSTFGGGVNSTAMLVEIAGNERYRDIRPDLITFADTGGERPETYEYLPYFSDWLESREMPRITVVKKVTQTGDVQTLEEECLSKKVLPSVAYGFKTCSQKYKVQPQDKYLNNWPPALQSWKEGKPIIKLLGYDAGEERRMFQPDGDKYINRYPLIEWGWDRDDCVAAITRAGLKLPGKSACFFCPNSRRSEIVQIKVTHPDLLQRALAMEANAETTSVKGLGRRFAWRDVVSSPEICGLDSTDDMPCGCYDGGSEEETADFAEITA